MPQFWAFFVLLNLLFHIHLHVFRDPLSTWLQEWTIDLTGEMSPIKRVSFWEAKRVFFVTPQVLEKDIESGESLKMIYHIIII